MRYTVLTNFDNYTSNISCNNKGVITLTLTPNRIKDISRKTNIVTKKRETYFDSKICTSYKKNDSEYLFKFTNHKPSQETTQFNTYEVLGIENFNIPTDKQLEFPKTRREYLINNYRNKKLNRLGEKYHLYLKKYN